jgi:hypothetical protein
MGDAIAGETLTHPETGPSAVGHTVEAPPRAGRSRAARARLGGMLVALAAVALLMANAAARANGSDLPRLFNGWRAWDDLAIAVGVFEQGDFPVAPYAIGSRTSFAGGTRSSFASATPCWRRR